MFHSPLRYPGGKGRLAQYVIDLIRANRLTGCHYIEPYAGGAGIAISLLYLEQASQVHLNDLNKSVHAFWRSVLDEPDDLCRLISDADMSMDEWVRQRAVQRDNSVSALDLGFSTFYLNRTNRSGIIQGGVIGGKGQEGNWKLDARFNRPDLIRRIQKIASYANRIKLYNLDALDLLKDVVPTLPDKSLIYLDPPYYYKGKNLYEHHYDHADHQAISCLVSDIRQHWIVSYDDVPAIRDMYSKYRQQIFGLRWSAQTSHDGVERMIFGNGLSIPGIVEPHRGLAA